MAEPTRDSALATRKINNVKCGAIPTKGEEDKRPIKGHEVIERLYVNIALIGATATGKTSAVRTIIQRCAGRDTSIIAFVATLNNDTAWETIREECENKGMPFFGYTSLIENDVNQLDTLVQMLQERAEAEREKKEKEKEKALEPAKPPSLIRCIPAIGAPAESKERKPRKTSYRAPEYIIVLDDLSTELKNKSVVALLKASRHFKCKVIISTQWLNDIPPQSLRQLGVVCVFRGQSDDKLEELHRKLTLTVPLDRFMAMYRQATAVPYSFLYIDTNKHQYRIKFSELFA